MKPITPTQATKQKKLIVIPDWVLEVVNLLIIDNLYNGYATVKQDDIIKCLVAKGYKQDRVYDSGWLNIEETYRSAGWKVEYDKPAYNESYPATFKFTATKKT